MAHAAVPLAPASVGLNKPVTSMDVAMLLLNTAAQSMLQNPTVMARVALREGDLWQMQNGRVLAAAYEFLTVHSYGTWENCCTFIDTSDSLVLDTEKLETHLQPLMEGVEVMKRGGSADDFVVAVMRAMARGVALEQAAKFLADQCIAYDSAQALVQAMPALAVVYNVTPIVSARRLAPVYDNKSRGIAHMISAVACRVEPDLMTIEYSEQTFNGNGDGAYLLIASSTTVTVFTMNMASRCAIWSAKLGCYAHICTNHTAKRVAVCTSGGVEVYERTSGKGRYKLWCELGVSAHQMGSMTPDGDRLALVTGGGDVKVWDMRHASVENGQLPSVIETLTCTNGFFSNVAFAHGLGPWSAVMLASGQDLHVFDLCSGEFGESRSTGHENGIHGLTVGLDSVVVTSGKHSIKAWVVDLDQEKKLKLEPLADFGGHQSGVRAMAVLPRSERAEFISISGNTMRLWSCAKARLEYEWTLTQEHGHTMVVSPCHRYIAVSGAACSGKALYLYFHRG